jgi:hypothetical protein
VRRFQGMDGDGSLQCGGVCSGLAKFGPRSGHALWYCAADLRRSPGLRAI